MLACSSPHAPNQQQHVGRITIGNVVVGCHYNEKEIRIANSKPSERKTATTTAKHHGLCLATHLLASSEETRNPLQ